ncbi:hypothetical protein HU200_022449 [Digitaria exilis]|uniref:Uncharacterized protein n=1 Tax=Digitaria exilis TaxID=1010633 RepID=A0A835C327_9POAL|nr:hypothetical protein HU200_022449 [Digitaria exilis]
MARHHPEPPRVLPLPGRYHVCVEVALGSPGPAPIISSSSPHPLRHSSASKLAEHKPPERDSVRSRSPKNSRVISRGVETDMDAPAMLTRKHVPEDVGLRNAGELPPSRPLHVTALRLAACWEDGGQGQLHRDDKEHKPVLKKVKEKVKKIKSTLTGQGHGHGHGSGDEHGGGDERMGDDAAWSNSNEEGEEDVAEREAAMEKGGYMEDVEDKPVLTEADPEVHGAPMYESERTPAVQDLVAKYDPAARAPAAVQERQGHGAPGVRLGDLGGPVVEDPAAPRSTTPAARVLGNWLALCSCRYDTWHQFENMNLSDDPSHVGAGKEDARVEEWKDAAADKMGGGGAAGGATYTDKLKNAAMGTTEYSKKLASTLYEKVAGAGTAAGAAKSDGERAETVPEASDMTGVEERKMDAPAAATDATNATSGGVGYTDKIKSAAAGTTQYGKQLASTAYEKVAGVAPNLRPQVGAAKPEDARSDEAVMPVSDNTTGTEEEEEFKDAPAPATTTDTNTTNASSGPGYTDKIKSAAMGTTEYGKQLASTVYEKVAGVGSTVASKVPGAGSQQQQDTNTNAGVGQDKGVTMTGYIAEKLRPGDEHRELSSAISGAVQQRKEDVGSTVAQRVPAPGDVITKAREAVTSLTGGNRVSETVQPGTATVIDHELTREVLCVAGEEVKEGYAAEAPVIHGEEQLASTAYEKVAGVGTAKPEDARSEEAIMPVSDTTGTEEEEWKDAPVPATTSMDTKTTTNASGPGYTDTLKNAAMHGHHIARQGTSPRNCAQGTRTVSSAQRSPALCSGARRMSVAQRMSTPGPVITKVREAVTLLTGRNRVSEIVQSGTAIDELCVAGEEVKEGYAAEAPVIHGEEICAPRLNTNTM